MIPADPNAKPRQVIPRFLPFRIGKILSETQPTSPAPPVGSEHDLNKKKVSWNTSPTIINAVELVDSTLSLNAKWDEDSHKALELITLKINSPKLLNDIRGAMAGDIPMPSLNSQGDQIREIRKSLIEFPNNPFGWLDLAYFYASLGHKEKAERAMVVSLQLNSDNRFILRSASRFFLHIHEPERALKIIRNCTNWSNDPWLVSAEISIANTFNRSALGIKKGSSILKFEQFAPKHTTELASALGTLEEKNGNTKASKKLIKNSLVQPTENAVAQAQWLQEKLHFELDISKFSAKNMHEAKSMADFKNKEYVLALNEAKNWQVYQPFSLSPAIWASYIASTALDDHEQAIEILTNAKKISDSNSVLNNNLIFSYASSGKIDEAEKILTEVSKTEQEDPNILATRGLILFRKGNASAGRTLYEKAISEFKRDNLKKGEVAAKFFLAKEELRIQSPNGIPLMKEALELAGKFGLNELLTSIGTSKK